MSAGPDALDALVLTALAGDPDAYCADFGTARRVVAILALNRNAGNRRTVNDWMQAIAEMHPDRDLSTH